MILFFMPCTYMPDLFEIDDYLFVVLAPVLPRPDRTHFDLRLGPLLIYKALARNPRPR